MPQCSPGWGFSFSSKNQIVLFEVTHFGLPITRRTQTEQPPGYKLHHSRRLAGGDSLLALCVISDLAPALLPQIPRSRTLLKDPAKPPQALLIAHSVCATFIPRLF